MILRYLSFLLLIVASYAQILAQPVIFSPLYQDAASELSTTQEDISANSLKALDSAVRTQLNLFLSKATLGINDRAALDSNIRQLLDKYLPLATPEPPTRKNDSATLTIYGSGLAGGTKTGGLTGAFGVLTNNPTFEATAMLNPLSSTDTLASNFGSAVLNPVLNAGSLRISGTFDIRVHRLRTEGDHIAIFGIPLSPHLTIQAAQQRWRYSPDTTGKNDTLFSTVTLATTLGLSYALYNGSELTILLDGSFITRSIHDDLFLETHKVSRGKMLGSTNTFFSGYELAITGRYNQLSFGISFPYLFGPPIDGLTKGRFNVGIYLQADVKTSKELWGPNYEKMASDRKKK